MAREDKVLTNKSKRNISEHTTLPGVEVDSPELAAVGYNSDFSVSLRVSQYA